MNTVLITFLKRGFGYAQQAFTAYYADHKKDASIGFINAADTAITAAELLCSTDNSVNIELFDAFFKKFRSYQFALLNDFAQNLPYPRQGDVLFGELKDIYVSLSIS